MAEECGVIYDINKVHLYVGERGKEEQPIKDLSPDGFGISPTGESALIEGLTGFLGFSIDPRTGAEATISLKSTSPSNEFLRGLIGKVITVRVLSDNSKITGFKERKIDCAMIRSPSEFATEGKDSPNIVYNIIGFNYTETGAT
jgi:hypothetical protein